MNEELAMIYAKENINPIATILPVFVQLPIFVSLYKAITQLDKEDVHFQDSFLWIPSLTGPQFDSGSPLGWVAYVAENQNYLYLILPILLVATQVFSQKYNAPPTKSETWIYKLVEALPLLSGLTALSSPAGLGIYWYTNTVLSFLQSVYVKAKLKDEGLDINQIAIDNQTPMSQ